MARSLKVCPTPGCPELVDKQHPCPTHSRPLNARWSKDRDGSAQHRFRAKVLEHDNYTCTRCRHYDPTGSTLDAHHISRTEGVTLCNSKANGCHGQVDKHAR